MYDPLFNGFYDKSVSGLAYHVLKERYSFVPFRMNYDVFCEKVNSDDASIQEAQQQTCATYDINKFSVSSPVQNLKTGGFEFNSSVTIFDNNYYNLCKLDNFDLGTVRSIAPINAVLSSTSYIALLAVQFEDVPLALITLQPCLLYVSLIGYFRIVYDVFQDTNIFNKFDSNNSAGTLYLEPLPKHVAEKEVNLQTTVALTDNQRVQQIYSQMKTGNSKVYFLRQQKAMPVIISPKYPVVASITLKSGMIKNFGIGPSQNDIDVNTYIANTSIFYTGQKLVVYADSVATFSSTFLDSILSEGVVTNLVVSFCLNTVTVACSYNHGDKKSFYLERSCLGGAQKDKCFAISKTYLQNDQIKISYLLTDYHQLATSWNIQLSSSSRNM
jgi:hypothetical protein